jgi:hypothetical protein
LLRYTPSGKFFARIRVKGRVLRRSLKTSTLSVAKLRLASTIGELYWWCWDIEKLFKQIKQSLQLCDFVGNNANAVHCQIWTALLVYVLLRYLVYLSRWGHSFTRAWAIIRSTLWRKFDLRELLESYGTAGALIARLLPNVINEFVPEPEKSPQLRRKAASKSLLPRNPKAEGPTFD